MNAENQMHTNIYNTELIIYFSFTQSIKQIVTINKETFFFFY